MNFGRDLRKNPRVGPILIRADFQQDGSRPREGYLTNLSAGGAFLATENPPAIGSKLALRILMPWKIGEIQVSATVVWSTNGAGERARHLPGGVGVSFVEVPAAVEEKLHFYMRRFCELAAQIED